VRFRAVAVVLGLVGACGDGIAPPDAVPPIDGPAGRVTVRMGPSEAATVQVIFQNADSSLVLATRTGPDGTANAFMAPGGFVTVIEDGSFSKSLYTWAGVQPGDVLTLGAPFLSPGHDSPSFPIQVPLDEGQDFYELLTSCGSSFLQTPGGISFVTLTGGCTAREDLLVLSRDVTFDNERYLYAADVTLDGSLIEMPDEWRAFESASVEVSGVPRSTRSMNVVMSLLDDGRPIDQMDRGGTFDLAGGAGALAFQMPLPAGAGALVRITPGFQPDAVSTLRAVRWGLARSTTVVDFSQRLRTYREFPSYLPSLHAIRWSEEGSAAAPDAVITELGWREADLEPRNWVIVAPGSDEPIVRFPVLPLPSLMPDPENTIFQPSTLTTLRLDGGGYARVKKNLPITWGSGASWPMDAAEGTIIIQELGSPQFPFFD